MKIYNSIKSEYPIGILWNMGSKFSKEMMLKIALMKDVIQVNVYDLKDQYAQFVLECYEGDKEAYEDGYIYDKIKAMKSNNTRIVAFLLKIDNPTYKTAENGTSQCIEAREIKQKIRDEYSVKIDGYFFDNLIHISDNTEEMQRVLTVLKKYKEFAVAEYVRKGYQPVIERETNSNTVKENKTYISLLKELKEEKDER